jgi:crotonobetainyl-CoA:carnitine CoA-transferase CaiB-like acyl-CoA transferase
VTESQPEPPAALAGSIVLEWASGRAGAYAGRLLRGLGAGVVLLERDEASRRAALHPEPGPAGARKLDALIQFLHGGKKSVALDPVAPGARERLLHLGARADVLLVDRPLAELDAAGLSPERIAEGCPQLVVVAVTLAGLHPGARNLRHADLVAHAIGGIAYGTPARVPDPATYPPIKPGGYQADYTAGLVAACNALLGLQLRRRTGRGQLFDVAAQAIMASYMRMDIAFRTYNGGESSNISSATRLAPEGRGSTLWGLVPCKDGYWAFQATEQYQWEGLMRTMGDPEWARDPRFQDPFERLARWEEIEPHFLEWSREHTKDEVFHAGQVNHVPVFPCYTVEELLRDPQQQAGSFFVELPRDGLDAVVRVPGAIVHFDRTPWRFAPGVPAAGEHTDEVLSSLSGGVRG